MILPGNHSLVLLLLVLGMVCWGTWANTFKASESSWRFELYYFDFAVGLLLAATVTALTFGSLGFDGFSFIDDIRLGGRRQDVFGLAGGAVFNLGNMLLLAAVSLAGMSVAFPVAWGIALLVAVGWSFVLTSGAHSALLSAAALVVLGAVAVDALAFRDWSKTKLAMAAEAPRAGTGKPLRKTPRKTVSWKGILLGIAGGLMLGSFAPLLRLAMSNENGLGPYSTAFMLAVGALFSTFVYNLFFMNLPVRGEPVDLGEYLRAKVSQHGTGILGGMLWYVGIITALIATRVDAPAKVGASLAYALSQGAPVIAALCGLFIWKEFAGADSKIKTYLVVVLTLLVIGIALASVGTAVPASAT